MSNGAMARGNMMSIGDRNSSRVLAAPGGNSSFSFGGDEPAPARSNSVAAAAPALPNKQDSFGQRVENRSEHGDFGMQRNSSRVLAAPGGNSSFSFGGDEPAPARPNPAAAVAPAKQDSFGQRIENRSEHGDFGMQRNSSRVLAAPGGNSSFSFGGDEPAPAVSRATSQQEVVPGSMAAGARRTEEGGISERSSTRIHAAPGGNSSIHLGGDSSCIEDRKAMLMARRAQAPFAEKTNYMSDRPF